jgi:hypothetical protein
MKQTTQLHQFGPSIWSVDGGMVEIGSFPYRTRMAVVKLSNGDGAWIWSPTKYSKQLASEIEELVGGPVAHIVSPNKLHHLNLKEWSEHYPEARVYAPPGLKGRSVVQGVVFTDDLGDDPHKTFANDFDQVVFRNRLFMEEVVFFHKESRTALFCDLIQRYQPVEAEGLKGLKRRMDGLVGDPGGTPREWVWSFLLGKDKVREATRVVVDRWQPHRLLIAHGDCVDSNAADVIARALKWAL